MTRCVNHDDKLFSDSCLKQVSRYVPYIETYKKRIFIFKKTLSRYNYRWEHYTQWDIEDTCCPGYAEDLNVCRPVCSGDCPMGLCVRPDECSCNIGYILVNTESGQACEPHCPLDCTFGTCTAPNTCTCNDGYELDDQGRKCVPSCTSPRCGLFSTCLSPENCVCAAGYKKASDSKIEVHCEPICDPACSNNSYCASPNKCLCDPGYKISSATGSSSEPVTCVPECSPGCENHSSCIAPNKCECHSGYASSSDLAEQNGDSMTQCYPVCVPSCGPHGICESPNKCSCNTGFNLIIERNTTTLEMTSVTCQPICDPPCGIRGDCVAPNTCSCDKGWKIMVSQLADKIDRYCTPHCEQACGEFSTCIKTDVCECHPGYQIIPSDQAHLNSSEPINCRPICEKPCINGVCASPNSCDCNDGYILDTDDPYNCEPNCGKEGCINGFCSAPEQCTCNKGYQLSNNSQSICDPVCNNCVNGACIAPNACVCNLGYEENEAGQCVPSCYGRCINGSCIAPNKCQCNAGFVSNLDSDNLESSSPMCRPHCTSNCTNGTCTSPDVCICNPGYEKNDKEECVPNCDGRCNFGHCVAPGECNCYSGYVAVDDPISPCQPYCKDGCINSLCVRPGTCQCDSGYTASSINASYCEPICQGDCTHGDCIGPNDCQCHQGLVWRKPNNETESDGGGKEFGSCVNPCEGGCGDHGICNVENRTCDCFYGWADQNCGSASLCGIIRNDGDEDLLRWIVDRFGTANDTVNNLEAINWHGPSCNAKCSLSSASSNVTECFRLLAFNNDSKDQRYNQSHVYVCFLDFTSSCNSESLKTSNVPLTSIVSVVPVIIAIAVVAGIILIVVKRRKSQIFQINVISTDNLLEPSSELTNSLIYCDEDFSSTRSVNAQERSDINYRTESFKRTPLMLAIEGISPEIVDLLVKKGARVDDCDEDGVLPLYYIICNPNNVNSRLNVDMIERDGYSKVCMLMSLINVGANIKETTESAGTKLKFLRMAITYGEELIVRYLVESAEFDMFIDDEILQTVKLNTTLLSQEQLEDQEFMAKLQSVFMRMEYFLIAGLLRRQRSIEKLDEKWKTTIFSKACQ
ncbi:hypothetical protein KQX54_008159 [Cotesia glomerata]|uniref:EGF-like domain-containing protein n=1 Tax=Cotesia glomerata TaxID=32391 RepID=A0AAV7J8C6_COTGL|nr:hypothetical protein KQX54_008159 [Cotesia glomerata]